MTRRMIVALAAATSLPLLAGCGGGGASIAVLDPPTRPVTTAPTLADAQSADPAQLYGAGESAARSLPRFGSVTQSSNREVSGITDDAASTAFDGNDVTLTINRRDGSRLKLDSAIHELTSQSLDDGLAGRSSRGYWLLDYTNRTISAAAV